MTRRRRTKASAPAKAAPREPSSARSRERGAAAVKRAPAAVTVDRAVPSAPVTPSRSWRIASTVGGSARALRIDFDTVALLVFLRCVGTDPEELEARRQRLAEDAEPPPDEGSARVVPFALQYVMRALLDWKAELAPESNMTWLGAIAFFQSPTAPAVAHAGGVDAAIRGPEGPLAPVALKLRGPDGAAARALCLTPGITGPITVEWSDVSRDRFQPGAVVEAEWDPTRTVVDEPAESASPAEAADEPSEPAPLAHDDLPGLSWDPGAEAPRSSEGDYLPSAMPSASRREDAPAAESVAPMAFFEPSARETNAGGRSNEPADASLPSAVASHAERVVADAGVAVPGVAEPIVADAAVADPAPPEVDAFASASTAEPRPSSAADTDAALEIDALVEPQTVGATDSVSRPIESGGAVPSEPEPVSGVRTSPADPEPETRLAGTVTATPSGASDSITEPVRVRATDRPDPSERRLDESLRSNPWFSPPTEVERDAASPSAAASRHAEESPPRVEIEPLISGAAVRTPSAEPTEPRPSTDPAATAEANPFTVGSGSVRDWGMLLHLSEPEPRRSAPDEVETQPVEAAPAEAARAVAETPSAEGQPAPSAQPETAPSGSQSSLILTDFDAQQREAQEGILKEPEATRAMPEGAASSWKTEPATANDLQRAIERESGNNLDLGREKSPAGADAPAPKPDARDDLFLDPFQLRPSRRAQEIAERAAAASVDGALSAPGLSPEVAAKISAFRRQRSAKDRQYLWVLPVVVVFAMTLFALGWAIGGGGDRSKNDPVHASAVVSFLSAIGLGPGEFQVDVTSIPDASISVDGEDLGIRTPRAVRLIPGTHQIRLSIGDLGSMSKTVTGKKNERLGWTADLRGSIDVQGPRGRVVGVSVDGIPVGRAPVVIAGVAPGTHELTLHMDGGTTKRPVRVPPGQQIHVSTSESGKPRPKQEAVAPAAPASPETPSHPPGKKSGLGAARVPKSAPEPLAGLAARANPRPADYLASNAPWSARTASSQRSLATRRISAAGVVRSATSGMPAFSSAASD